MFTELVSEIFGSFTVVIEKLAGGLKSAFTNLIYVDPAAEVLEMSPLVTFTFVMLGVGLATGILYKILGLIKRRG